MKKRVLSVFLCFLFVCMTICIEPAVADELEVPSVSAQASILMCANNGEILFEKSADKHMLIASTTKIMTAVLALEAVAIEDKQVEFTADMIAEGSSMYLKVGDVLRLSDLVKGLMAASGNDASNAIAISVAGSKEAFADMMNERAESLGMTNTHFVTPSGLDADEHYSTARDMAVLMSYAMENEAFSEIVSQKNVSVDFIKPQDQRNTYHNHNRLLSTYQYCIGGKTGFTKAAGRCLVTCAERDGVQLIAVTLNAPNDWNDHAKLFDYGFSVVKTVELDDTKTKVNVPVVGSDVNSVDVAVRNPVECVIKNDENLKAECVFELPHFLYAPLKAGEKVGKAVYIVEGKEIARVDIVTTLEVKALREDDKGFFSKIWDNILKLFK